MKVKNKNNTCRKLKQLGPILKSSKGWIILNGITAFISGLIMIYFVIVTKDLTDMAIN